MTQRDRKLVEQEPEGLALGKIVLVLGVSLLIATASVGVAWLLMDDPPVTGEQRGDDVLRESVGELYTTRIRRRAIGLEKRREGHRHLETYGWTDEDDGVAHIPIERAMEVYLERHGRPEWKEETQR